MTFLLPESLRRIVEGVDHESMCESWEYDGDCDCDCWLSLFWAEVERLEGGKG